MRFQPSTENTKKKSSLWTYVFIIVVITLFFMGISITAKGNKDRQRRYLEEALANDITYCYAITGAYPDSLETIKTKYGLVYDEDTFFVDYRVIGKNIYPKITILEKP